MPRWNVKRYRVILEGVNGPMREFWLSLDELKHSGLPGWGKGWLPLWETLDGEDRLSLLSPEYMAEVHRLNALCRYDASEVD